MGYWLLKTFQSARATEQPTLGTDVFNLPKKGIISNLCLEVYLKSGNVNADIYVPNAITKIEVIGNGSTVIQSLDGRQVQASQAYDDQKWSMDKEVSPSGGCWAYFDIRFGRFVGDQKYALDCSKWDSLELKISYDKACVAAGGTIGTTGFVTALGTLTIYGLFSPDGAGLSPVGFIKKAEKKTYTSAVDGTEDLALPDDYPYRRLLLFQETKVSVPYEGFQYVTIDIDNGARKPIDNMSGADLFALQGIIAGNPMWRHWKRYWPAAQSLTISPPIRWIANAWAGGMAHGANTAIEVMDLGALTIVFFAGIPVVVHEEGYCPWGALIIDLERQSGKDGVEAMQDCWGYDQSASIHLKHTQQVASLALSVVLEQYAAK